jgi:hypothetical protein
MFFDCLLHVIISYPVIYIYHLLTWTHYHSEFSLSILDVYSNSPLTDATTYTNLYCFATKNQPHLVLGLLSQIIKVTTKLSFVFWANSASLNKELFVLYITFIF